VTDRIRDCNLELLIGLKQHLDQAAKLRDTLDRLLRLAEAQAPAQDRTAGPTAAKGGTDAR
jgi:hypothetical protein